MGIPAILLGIYTRQTLFVHVFTFLAKLLYFIGKWLLLVIDLIFFYVQELCGMNMDYSSIDALFSGESDIVFRMLYASKHTVTAIMKRLIVLAIFFIIFFSIVAIIIGQYKSYKDGKPPKPLDNIKNMLKHFLLVILTPMIALVMIVASNLLLQAFYNATNVSQSVSMGTKIFYSASTSANRFRIYANKDNKIPIRYNSAIDNSVLQYFDDASLNSEFVSYIMSTHSVLYSAASMFANEEFLKFSDIDATQATSDDYYLVFDKNHEVTSTVTSSVGFDYTDYIGIFTNREEYYVMADVIDFAMNSSVGLYYKTPDDIFESIYILDISDDEKNKLMTDIVNNYFGGIEFKDNVGNVLYTSGTIFEQYANYRIRSKRNYDSISWSSTYYSVDSGNEPSVTKPITYYHFHGQSDEYEGATYVISAEKSIKTTSGVTLTYYVPLTNGLTVKSRATFSSNYMKFGQVVSAKGLLDEDQYPTAIKKDSYGNVVFYRENLTKVLTGKTSDLIGLNYEPDPSVDDSGANFFQRAWKRIKGFFDPSNLIPKIEVNEQAIKDVYTSELSEMKCSLENGGFRIGYMMGVNLALSDSITNAISDGLYDSFKITDIYNIRFSSFNYLILFASVTILLKIMFGVIFSLIERAYELFILFIFYPTACATLPLTNKGYETWFNKFKSRLFSAFGVMIGINFVFMLFPVIDSIKFFKPEDLAQTVSVKRTGIIFLGLMDINTLTGMLNFVFCVMLELVALNMIKDIPSLMSALTGFDGLTQSNVLEEWFASGKDGGKKGKLMVALDISMTVFSGGSYLITKNKDKLKNAADIMMHPVKHAKDYLKKHAPFSSIVNEAKDMSFMRKKDAESRKARQDLMDAMNRKGVDGKSGYDKDAKSSEVQTALDEYLKKDEEATKARSFDKQGFSSSRKAAEDMEKKNKDMGLKSSKDGEMDYEDEPDFENMSKREIRRYTRKLKRRIGSLKRTRASNRAKDYFEDPNWGSRLIKKLAKANNPTLTPEEQFALEKSQALLKKASEALGEARGESKEYNRARKTKRRLEKRMKKGKVLDPNQQKKLDEANDIIANGEYAQRKNRVTARKEAEEKKREEDKANGIKARNAGREARRAQKDLKIFTGSGLFNSMRRSRRLKQVNGEMSKLKSNLNNLGITVDVDKMKIDDVMKLANNDKQKAVLEEYVKRRKLINQFSEISANEIAASNQYKAEQNKNKNTSIAGGFKGLGRLRFISNIRNNANIKKYSRVDEHQAEIAKIDEQLKKIEASGGVNASNFAEVQKLNAEKAKHQRIINESNDYLAKAADGSGARRNQRQQSKDEAIKQRAYDEAVKICLKKYGSYEKKYLDAVYPVVLNNILAEIEEKKNERQNRRHGRNKNK